jgi:hypothetical protein
MGFAIPSNVASVVATFWMYHDTGYSTKDDRIQFQVSTNGVTWNNVGATQHRYNGTNGWSQVSLDLSAYQGQSSVQLGFLGTSAFGNNIYLDDLVVSAQSSTTAPDAPVIHTVTPGRGSVSLGFSAPANNGGSAIVAYAATCTASNQPTKTATGAGLTLTVRGLKGGVAYACTVKASNALFTSSTSAAWAAIPQPAGDLTPILMLLFDAGEVASSVTIPQTISFVSAPGSIAVNGTGAVTAASSSNLPVLLSSKTTNVCTISGNTVSGISEGSCTIAGNQPGDSTYTAAPEVTKTIAIVATGSSVCPGLTAPQYSQRISFTGGIVPNILLLAKNPSEHTTGAFQFNAGTNSGLAGFSFETNVIPQGSFSGKTVALSTCPGDFTGIGVTQGSIKRCDQQNSSPFGGISFAVGSIDARYCTLVPGGTYYLNIKSGSIGESITFNLVISPPP